MTTYSGIDDTEIAPDEPVRSTMLTKLRDNVLAIIEGDASAISAGKRIATAALFDDAVTQDKIANDAVGQDQLKASTGDQTLNGDNLVTLPGGQYGFWPRISQTTGGQNLTVSLGTLASASLGSYLSMLDGAGGGNTTIEQSYINASAPYEFNGHTSDFYNYLRLDSSGNIKAIWSADCAPYHYNGPTEIKPHRRCAQSGRAWRIEKRFDRFDGCIVEKEIEITPKYKNIDCAVIPHPFGWLEEGDQVLLLDPVGAHDLADLRQHGESISALISDGYIRFDNTALDCHTVGGVKCVKWKWKG